MHPGAVQIGAGAGQGGGTRVEPHSRGQDGGVRHRVHGRVVKWPGLARELAAGQEVDEQVVQQHASRGGGQPQVVSQREKKANVVGVSTPQLRRKVKKRQSRGREQCALGQLHPRVLQAQLDLPHVVSVHQILEGFQALTGIIK